MAKVNDGEEERPEKQIFAERGHRSLYDESGHNITYEGAREILLMGESVMIHGVLYTRLDTLPSEAVFASGDPQREEMARKNLEKQIMEAQHQLSLLDKGLGTEQNEPTKPGAAGVNPVPPSDQGGVIQPGTNKEADKK